MIGLFTEDDVAIMLKNYTTDAYNDAHNITWYVNEHINDENCDYELQPLIDVTTTLYRLCTLCSLLFEEVLKRGN